VKLGAVLGTVLVAVTVQAVLARYTVGGQWAFDLVLVGVVFAALRGGAVAGILAGTIGGLLHDLMAGTVVGVGGLAKTVVGFGAGTVGAQFVLAHSGVRTLVVLGATLVHRLMIQAIMGMIAEGWILPAWQALLGELVINGAVAFILFRLTDAAPGLMARGRLSRRSGLSRRQW